MVKSREEKVKDLRESLIKEGWSGEALENAVADFESYIYFAEELDKDYEEHLGNLNS